VVAAGRDARKGGSGQPVPDRGGRGVAAGAQGGGVLSAADRYLFAALLVCAAGYTEGGGPAGGMPGWLVVSWALVLCLPLTVPVAAVAPSCEPAELTGHAVAGLLWVAAGSQFPGLVVGYRGVTVIGIPRAVGCSSPSPCSHWCGRCCWAST